jgi:hypothetical protein
VPELNASSFDAERHLWNTCQEIYGKRGINLKARIFEWTSRQSEKPPLSDVRAEFEELCECGCSPAVLAALMVLFRKGPEIEHMWTSVVGGSYQRERAQRNLERAAKTIEQMCGGSSGAETPEWTASIRKTGNIPPTEMVSQLRLYATVLTLAEKLAEEIETRSLRELVRYVLAAYVCQVTGAFHDRCVSALVGAETQPKGCDEVAQRMWRNRNYQRLHAHSSWVADLLYALGVVISEPT